VIQVRTLVVRHQLAAFFVLAFAFSWAAWTVPALGYRDGIGAVLFIAGTFGPLAAAAVVTRLAGDSVWSWFKGLFVWRVPLRWYAFAFGVPITFAALVTVEFALAGEQLDWSVLDDRLVAYLPSLLFVALAGGGNEEPGWRGFALPRLQQRLTPVRATLILGGLWASWHLPVLFAAEDAEHGLAAWGVLALVALTLASIVGYAFAYTFLVNKTGSVLLAIAMHASFNVANGFAGLRTDEALQKTDYLLILGLSAATIWALVAVLVAVTHGRLGSGASAVVGRRPKPSAPRRVVPA
jgi:membrane protease YdiL (CAAX protease family)